MNYVDFFVVLVPTHHGCVAYRTEVAQKPAAPVLPVRVGSMPHNGCAATDFNRQLYAPRGLCCSKINIGSSNQIDDINLFENLLVPNTMYLSV